MEKIGAMKSTEDSFLVELLSPASAFLKKSIDDIDNMGLSEIETELSIEVFHPTRPGDTRGGLSTNDHLYSVETEAKINKRKKYLNKKYF